MEKQQRVIIALLVLVLLALGLLLGVAFLRFGGFRSGPRVYSTPVVLQQVKALSQLVTVQYVMERVVIMEVPPDSAVLQMFPGAISDNRLLLLAHGVVKAGIDLQQLKPDDLAVSGRNITLRLPAARITDAYLDDKETKVIERKTGFLRSFDKDLEQTVRQQAVEDIRRAARQAGIQRDAEERVRLQLQNLFLQLGFEKVEFEAQ